LQGGKVDKVLKKIRVENLPKKLIFLNKIFHLIFQKVSILFKNCIFYAKLNNNPQE
jgi:hypothetical protein